MNATLFFIILLSYLSLLEAGLILEGLKDPVLFIKWKEIIPLPKETLTLVHFEQTMNENITGKLVYIDYPLYGSPVWIRPYLKSLDDIRERGAIGIITTSLSDRRQLGFNYYSNLRSDMKLTTGFMSKDGYNYFRKAGSVLNVTFDSWDENPWDAVFGGPGTIIYSAILFCLFFFNIGLAVYKIIEWRLLRGKISLALGIVCLFLEIAVNIDRCVQAILFPTYNYYGVGNVDITLSLSVCLTCIIGILVIFFWFDITLDPFFHKSGRCFGMMKLPTIIGISVLVILEIILDTTRSYLKIDVSQIIITIYIVLLFILSIFYFISGYRILKLSEESHVKKKLRWITFRIVWSGVSCLVATIMLILVVSPATYKPAAFVGANYVYNFGYFVQSLILITIFSPPVKEEDRGSSASKHTPVDLSSVPPMVNQ